MNGSRILAIAFVIGSSVLGAQTDGRIWTTPTLGEVDAIYPDIEALYIDLHRNPELAFAETQTAAKLAARVRALGFDVTAGVGGTGIVAVMKNGAGPTVMLRTELDALPVEEKTGLPFASTIVVKSASGQSTPVMHACGHDVHMAAWAGTARLMAEHRDRWRGTLVMVGQPAEETLGGASAMLKDGLFTRFPRPDFALSLHDDDTMPAGTIGYHPGDFRAMSDAVAITVYGRGGHAAMPQNTVDPIVLAARIVLALQTVVSRENNPVDPVVVTVGSIHGGTAGNIIPDEVRLQLSVRTYTSDVRSRTLAAIRRIAKGEASAAGAPREPQVDAPVSGNAPVYNDPALTLRLAGALKKALGESAVVEMPQKMTSEDFAEYGHAGVRSALLHIGAVNPARLAEAQRTGIAVPAPHSPEWAPERSPTLKGAIRAEVTELLRAVSRELELAGHVQDQRTILITGAAGNLGGLLSRHLVPSGHELRLMYHRRPLADDVAHAANVRPVKADLGDPATLPAAVSGVDVVVHFAGRLFAPRPERFLQETNTRWFSNLLTAALRAQVGRVILISFPHVEGPTSVEQPATGRLDRQPISVHARTRLEEERLLLERTQGTDTSPVVLRLGMIYGRGILMIEAARWLARRRLLCVWREPTLFQLLSIVDYLRAVEAAIFKPGVRGIYHVGDEQPVTLQRFLDEACRVWGYHRPVRVPFSMIDGAAWLCECVASIAGTPSPLTRDFVRLGRVSHWGDTRRARTELIPELVYPTLETGRSTL